VIKVQGDGVQRQVYEPAATNAEANSRNALCVNSGFVLHGTDRLATIEADGLYGLKAKQKFVATDADGQARYLDGLLIDPRFFELVNGGIRIRSGSPSDAIEKFKKLASEG
jgi:hypothetical protein